MKNCAAASGRTEPFPSGSRRCDHPCDGRMRRPPFQARPSALRNAEAPRKRQRPRALPGAFAARKRARHVGHVEREARDPRAAPQGRPRPPPDAGRQEQRPAGLVPRRRAHRVPLQGPRRALGRPGRRRKAAAPRGVRVAPLLLARWETGRVPVDAPHRRRRHRGAGAVSFDDLDRRRQRRVGRQRDDRREPEGRPRRPDLVARRQPALLRHLRAAPLAGGDLVGQARRDRPREAPRRNEALRAPRLSRREGSLVRRAERAGKLRPVPPSARRRRADRDGPRRSRHGAPRRGSSEPELLGRRTKGRVERADDDGVDLEPAPRRGHGPVVRGTRRAHRR